MGKMSSRSRLSLSTSVRQGGRGGEEGGWRAGGGVSSPQTLRLQGTKIMGTGSGKIKRFW